MINMIPRKKVIIEDVYTKMMVEIESLNEASRWFYHQNLSKTPLSALSNIQNSLKDQRIIYKRYFLRYKDE